MLLIFLVSVTGEIVRESENMFCNYKCMNERTNKMENQNET